MATLADLTLPIGDHTLTGRYVGDPSFNPSNAELAHTVLDTVANAPVITFPTPGATVTIPPAVAIRGTVDETIPGAVVEVREGGAVVCSATANAAGAWSCDAMVRPGAHTITARQTDVAGNMSANSTAVEFLAETPTTTELTTSQSPTRFGEQVVLTASVTGVAPSSGPLGGSVEFVVAGRAPQTVALNDGVAVLRVPSGGSLELPVGVHAVAADYAGTVGYLPSDDALEQEVVKADTTLRWHASASPSGTDEPVTFTATVEPVAPGAGMPTGDVEIVVDGGAPTVVPLVDGVATLADLTLPIGDHTLTGRYVGDPSFNPSNAELTRTVIYGGVPFPGPGGTIPSEGSADPYPSNITVSDVAGSIVAVRVTLTDLVHSATGDLNVVLQAPDGRNVALLSSCRGADDVDGTVTFADGGETLDGSEAEERVGSGTYGPSRSADPVLVPPGPQCPCGQQFASLAGADPNGTWSLFVHDDSPNDDDGTLAGWTLKLVTNSAPVATDGSFTAASDTELRDTLTGLASDADDDELAFDLTAEPTHGAAVVNRDGTFTYTPPAGFVGIDRFSYRIDDGRSADDGEVTITVVELDGRGPQARPTVSPAPNGAGWHNRDVTVRWNWTDDDTGVDPARCVSRTTSSGQGARALTATCRDMAGNDTTARRTVRVDSSAPSAAITLPAERRFLQGAVVTVDYACRDAVSGVARCSGGVADGDPINTSAPGIHHFAVTAWDRAGNQRTATISYTVIVPPTCNGRRATIVGTAGNDVLIGTSGADVIFAAGGGDWIRAGDGDDTICTGAAHDVIRSGDGNDFVDAGSARDIVIAGAGNDALTGHTGNDILVAGAGDDRVHGAAGDDTLLGGSNTDSCRGGPGTDRAAACERTLGVP